TRRDSAQGALALVPAHIRELDRALHDMPARREDLRRARRLMHREQRHAAGLYPQSELVLDLADEPLSPEVESEIGSRRIEAEPRRREAALDGGVELGIEQRDDRPRSKRPLDSQ